MGSSRGQHHADAEYCGSHLGAQNGRYTPIRSDLLYVVQNTHDITTGDTPRLLYYYLRAA